MPRSGDGADNSLRRSRPQPREAKTVSHLEQGDGDTVTFRMNLIQQSKGIERKLLVVRKSLSLVVLHDEHGAGSRKKAEETIPRRDEARTTAGRAVCLEAMKKYPMLQSGRISKIKYGT